MTKLEVIARPLVGMRSASTEDWWSYPMVIVYLAIDTSMEGRNGTCVKCVSVALTIDFVGKC